MTTLPPMAIESLQVERVWGGSRLAAGDTPIGERWGAFAGNRIANGPLVGKSLAEAARELEASLLGAPVVARFGARFPVLSKLLDTSEWLSVQLHPNDEQARELEGPEHVGKTEAWHLLDVDTDAEIILGLDDGVDRARFAEAVRAGATLDVLARQAAVSGETWFIPAGTVHALGPGLFLYEIQQASDITYRVYDWDRPASAGRELHLEQALRCVVPGAGERQPATAPLPGELHRLVACPYFALDKLALARDQAYRLDTGGQTFHALTAVQGRGRVVNEAGDAPLGEHETVIVPAVAGSYHIEASEPLIVLLASVQPK